MPDLKADIAVIGAGIVGLAHALAAAKRGHRVVLFERTPQAQGASIRNFGMIWPIGQAPGLIHQRALRTRQIWLDLAPKADIWLAQTGSLHLAYANDEYAVLAEFAALAPELGYSVELLDQDAVLARSHAVQPAGLQGGLWSTTELCVDPREAIAALPDYLAHEYGITLRFSTPVHHIDLPQIYTPAETWSVDRAIVCSGTDFESLYPQVFATSGLTRCKLQMMRTAPQPGNWRLGPMLAAGLTLRHYAAFKQCQTLAAYTQRIAAERPEFDQWGIHVMASQNGRGEIVIGDSHEYGWVIDPFDKPAIDQLILNYLQTFLAAPALHIAQRWHGIYAKHPDQADFIADPAPGVKIVNGISGAGMTTAFGLAEEVFAKWE
ncbi:MAG: TIGR03364 family FAD-dependent oxidoreductase [Candidatus Latescibacteria bacterium]|nr:TIGR03364 family FAD-dependent oxidoreductase [Candidatus Latescibacterota bacterium]